MAYSKIAVIIREPTFPYIARSAREKGLQFGAIDLPKGKIALYVRKRDYKTMLKLANRYKGFVEQE